MYRLDFYLVSFDCTELGKSPSSIVFREEEETDAGPTSQLFVNYS